MEHGPNESSGTLKSASARRPIASGQAWQEKTGRAATGLAAVKKGSPSSLKRNSGGRSLEHGLKIYSMCKIGVG
jgi:hypothetical protein